MSADTSVPVSTSTASSTSTSTEPTSTSSSSSCPSTSPTTSSCSHFPRIDLHTHILPEHIPDFASRYGYGEFIKLQHHHECKARMFKGDQFFREVEENCYRAEPRVKECDQLGTTVQVLSTVPVMFSYWAKPADCLDLSRMLNDHIASICRTYPTRFIGLGTIPMQSAEHAIPELQRCIQELGMVGIQIGTHINDKPLSDPMFYPIFEEAERLGACIFVHPWDMLGQDVMKKYWLPWLVGMPMETSFAICSLIFGGIFERLPKLRWCFAHGGGSFPGTIGRIEHGFAVRPDLVACDNKIPPRTYCGKFWLDSLVHDHIALKAIVDLCGVNKITLGSDYPFPLGEDKPGELVLSSPHLSDAEKHRILWENGFEFLGLDPAKYAPAVTSTLPTITTSNGEHVIIMDDENELDEKKHTATDTSSTSTSTSTSTSDSNSALNDLTAEVEALSMK